MPKLGVNIDHVATIREARRTFEPDPVAAALICQLAGADAIVAHLREDRRHIQDKDIQLLREVVKIKFNLEMAATEEMVKVATKIKPDQVTLVPERRQEVTTEGGLNVVSKRKPLETLIKALKREGIVVSLFIDPHPAQIRASAEVGAQAVELHTGEYANSGTEEQSKQELKKLMNGVKRVKELNLRVHAGHGLTYQNVAHVAAIEEIEELNIGHTIISRAVLVGLDKAVREMLALVRIG
ncbi:pyridoxine 5'-phosphate synthase [candidate division NPL-UPA2 bacterium]|nr:pyridoxine 5'-phosphate synthase [candidate division NPL-UPA2 bacterium]